MLPRRANPVQHRSESEGLGSAIVVQSCFQTRLITGGS